MTFEELKEVYLNLKELLEKKKQVLIHKNADELMRLDEQIICVYNDIKIIFQNKDELNLTQDQKDELNKIAQEIHRIEKDNEVLIIHSMNVINKLFEGILNITSSKSDDYNHLGKKNQSSSDFEISSIMEEA